MNRVDRIRRNANDRRRTTSKIFSISNNVNRRRSWNREPVANVESFFSTIKHICCTDKRTREMRNNVGFAASTMTISKNTFSLNMEIRNFSTEISKFDQHLFFSSLIVFDFLFQCQNCDRAFSLYADLEAHMKEHSKKKVDAEKHSFRLLSSIYSSHLNVRFVTNALVNKEISVVISGFTAVSKYDDFSLQDFRHSLVSFSRSIAAAVAKPFAIRTVYVGTLEQFTRPRAVSIRRATLSFFQITVSPSTIRSKTKRTMMNRWVWWFPRTTVRHRRAALPRRRSPTLPMISTDLHRENIRTHSHMVEFILQYESTSSSSCEFVQNSISSISFCRMAFLSLSLCPQHTRPSTVTFFLLLLQSISFLLITGRTWDAGDYLIEQLPDRLTKDSLRTVSSTKCLAIYHCSGVWSRERTNERTKQWRRRYSPSPSSIWMFSPLPVLFLFPLLLSIRSSLDIFLFLSVMLLRVLLYLIYANCVFLLSPSLSHFHRIRSEYLLRWKENHPTLIFSLGAVHVLFFFARVFPLCMNVWDIYTLFSSSSLSFFLFDDCW